MGTSLLYTYIIMRICITVHGLHLNVQLLDVVNCSDCKACLTCKRQAMRELTRVE